MGENLIMVELEPIILVRLAVMLMSYGSSHLVIYQTIKTPIQELRHGVRQTLPIPTMPG